MSEPSSFKILTTKPPDGYYRNGVFACNVVFLFGYL